MPSPDIRRRAASSLTKNPKAERIRQRTAGRYYLRAEIAWSAFTWLGLEVATFGVARFTDASTTSTVVPMVFLGMLYVVFATLVGYIAEAYYDRQFRRLEAAREIFQLPYELRSRLSQHGANTDSKALRPLLHARPSEFAECLEMIEALSDKRTDDNNRAKLSARLDQFVGRIVEEMKLGDEQQQAHRAIEAEAYNAGIIAKFDLND